MPFLELSDAKLNFEVIGDLSSQTPLCLLNGFTRPLTDFYSFSKTLQKHDIPHILLDHRGSGQSNEYETTSLEIMANDCVALLDFLKIETFHLLGISMGGIVSQKLCEDHASRIQKLFLVSTATKAAHVHKVHFSKDLDDNIIKAETYFSDRYLQGNKMLIKAIAKQVTAKVTEKHASMQSKAIDTFDFSNVVSSHQNKIHFIHGKEDNIMPIRYLYDVISKTPGVTSQIFDECGHLLLVERPKEFYQYVVNEIFQTK